jgi:hypothetical protein
MISVYALLCAAALSRADCTTDTAIDVIRMPDATNELACARDSMMTLASLAIQPQAGEYWKIICAHDELPVVAKSPQSGLPIALHTPRRDARTWDRAESTDRD